MNIDKDIHDLLVEAVEDAVSYACQEAFSEGCPLSGETAWNVVMCRATAKVAEFEGLLAPSTSTFTANDVEDDEEHY